jgi:cytoskeleton protein RodZ
MSFGEHLRRQRQMRGIALEEIVATTKISRRHLLALEEEQFELLPGGVFNRSYVRAYAKCVGIDEEEAVAEYIEAAHEAATNPRVIAQQQASPHSGRHAERSGFPLVPVLILLVLAAGSVGGWKLYQERQREKAQAATPVSPEVHVLAPDSSNAGASQQSAAAVSPTPSSASPSTARVQIAPASSEGATAPAATAPTALAANDPDQSAAAAPFVLVVRPKDRAWVSIKADGTYIVRGIIDPSDAKTVRANTQIVFYAANAHSVSLLFNGKEVAPEQSAGGPETLVFTAHGLAPRGNAQ